MRPKTPKLLEDIRDAAVFIEQGTAARSLDDYHDDRLLRQADERNFEINGEAVRRLTETDPGTGSRIDQHGQIIAFRNLLIHGYDLLARMGGHQAGCAGVAPAGRNTIARGTAAVAPDLRVRRSRRAAAEVSPPRRT